MYRMLKLSIVIERLQVLNYISNMIMQNVASNIWGTYIYHDSHYQIMHVHVGRTWSDKAAKVMIICLLNWLEIQPIIIL